ncbi:MAG: Gfo/Idh/MocA family oxidoreductase [Clostridia bacterium]|nr:Gfo/Idh/MocA family oxidoreductase [Clostridia bacterium]
MHKIGLIGYGAIASGYHNTTFQRDDIDFELTAVYDIRESQRTLAAERGFRTFDNLRDFLDSRLFEMVTIAVPNNNHCPLAVACLEAGYHVMVEKPCALTCTEIEQIMETAKRCGKLFTVHHNRRWDRDFLIVRQAIEAGLLGKLHTIESRIHPRNKEGGGLPGWRGLADHGGGMLLDWGIHMLDQMLYLIEEPIVSVTANIANHNGNEVDDWSRIIIQFENGPVATVETATFTPLWLPRWYAVGDEGALSMDFIGDTKCRIRRIAEQHTVEGTTTAYTLNGTRQRPVVGRCIDRFEEFDYPREGEYQPPQDWASLYKNLAGVLDGREELVVRPEQVLRVFRVVEAAFESARTRQSVLF